MSKTLIIGGVATGASAAARLRRLDEQMEIILFEKGEHISFANCGLPYHIGNVIKERESLILQTKDSMEKRFNLDVRLLSEVTSVDPEAKTVTIESHDRGTYTESFDYLVISPGAKPLKPNIPGINLQKVMSLRDLKDMDNIKAQVDGNENGRVIVIGGGFIGIEVAENLKERGMDVTLVEAAPQILAPLDKDMAKIVENEIRNEGITLHLDDGVASFEEEGSGIKVTLCSGKTLYGDFVVSSLGVVPDTDFLKTSGINLSQKGHILTDERMRTNFESVFAGGDGAMITDYLTGNPTSIPLAGPANRQGRIIADQIAGLTSTYKGSMGTSILKVFDLAVASTGMNERVAKLNHLEPEAIFIHPNNHAGYYPGATPLTIKLVYDKNRKVLGAQAVGYEGVDKFIDVIATTLKFNGTIDDLAELELAYAPPFLSAKSPANMAGFVAENTLNGLVDHMSVNDFSEDFNPKEMILLDVRDDMEVEMKAMESMIHIPLNDLRQRMNELPKDKTIIIYCQVGIRGYLASRILNQYGFTTKNLTGGFKLYDLLEDQEEKLPEPDFIPSIPLITPLKESTKMAGKTIEVDATGLCCPGPLMRVKSEMDQIKDGDTLKITASDMGFYEDIKAWTRSTGHNLLSLKKEKGLIYADIFKGTAIKLEEGQSIAKDKENLTMIVFSGDLDKAIATFIIANGAASMDKKVTLFFTFWGMNVIRKATHEPVKKNLVEKMFGFMMPKGSKKLGLSQMNMAGMGPKMIRSLMDKKNVQSLEELMKAAVDSGVELVACQMSMDLLGLKEEELIDGVKLGGVGYMLAESEDSSATLFI